MKSTKFYLPILLAAVIGGLTVVGAQKIFLPETSVQSPVDSFASETPIVSAGYSAFGDMASDFTAAAERTVNGVVHVKTQTTMQPMYNPWSDFFGYRQEPQVQMSSGSGVIISNDGYIITNNHVVEGAEKLSVTLNNNKNYEATVIGRDPSTDIAVIKIEEKNLPSIVWGNSEDVRIGQWVIAVGNPFDLTSTVTAGIVSAKARNINLIGNRNSSEEVFPVESFIQTDAAVNPGNSGGPLLNANGEVVGIVTFKRSAGEGLNFALSIIDALEAIQAKRPALAASGQLLSECGNLLPKGTGKTASK